jgi:hypothetical protein
VREQWKKVRSITFFLEFSLPAGRQVLVQATLPAASSPKALLNGIPNVEECDADMSGQATTEA